MTQHSFAGVLLLLVTSISISIAQPPRSGTIAGEVFNAEDNIPFEYANVVVSDTAGNMLKGLITDTEGKFIASGIPFGRPVTLEVSFIGFLPYVEDGVVLTPDQPFHQTGRITLNTDTELLDEVVVTGEKAVVQTSLDKKTYNVEKSAITKSKSVADVLGELPSVSVESDGTVTLRGNANVRILVDGESSLAQSGEIGLILQQLPAESVEKIDVVTNPSAKYDPEGTSGIINIILKKEKQRGINGTVSAGAGTIQKYNASTFISYRKNKLGLTANYNFRYYDSFGDGTLDRTTTTGGAPVYLHQQSTGDFDNMSHFGRLGFNIAANERNSISFGGLTTYFTFSRDGALESVEEDAQGEVLAMTGRDTRFHGSGRFSSANIYHTHNFKKESNNVRYGLNFSNFNGDFDGGYQADTIFMGDRYFVSEQETEVDAVSCSLDASMDFTLPVNENISEEAGYSSNVTWRDGQFFSRSRTRPSEPWTTDTSLLNDYQHDEQIHSVYANHIHSIGNFSYQVGLRLEQVIVEASSITNSEPVGFRRSYFSFYPSVYLRQSFGKEDAATKHELQLSYSRRVNRPSFRITNPYRDFSDPQNPRQGNPFLQPEFINSFELGYNKSWDKVTVNSTVFYKLTTDLFTRISTLIDTEENVILTSYDNLGRQHEIGFEFVSKFKLFEWWKLDVDFNIAQNIIRGTNGFTALSNEALSYGGKATATFTPWKGGEFQVIGRYRGPRVTTQGEYDGYGTLDLSLQQDILKKKGTITLSVEDVTNTAKRSGTISGEGFSQMETDKRESRVLWLTFSYGFGKMGEMFNKRNRNRGGGNDSGGGEEGVF